MDIVADEFQGHDLVVKAVVLVEILVQEMQVQEAFEIEAVVEVNADGAGLTREPCHVVGKLVGVFVQAADTAVGIRAAVDPDHYGRAGLKIFRHENVQIKAVPVVKRNSGTADALNGADRTFDGVENAAPGFRRDRVFERQIAYRRRGVRDAEIFVTPVSDDASDKTIFGCDCLCVIHKEILTCRRLRAQRGRR